MVEDPNNYTGDYLKWVTKAFLKASGSILILSGLYEGFTGHKITPLMDDYKNNAMDIVHQITNSMDNMPLILKLGGGLALFRLPRLLKK